MEVLSVSGLQTVFMPGGLLIRATDRWHALFITQFVAAFCVCHAFMSCLASWRADRGRLSFSGAIVFRSESAAQW